MNQVQTFLASMRDGNSITALLMLKDGRVDANACKLLSNGSKLPIMFGAIAYLSKEVITDLTHRGVNLDEIHVWRDRESISSVGLAISIDKRQILSLLLQLGASTSGVFLDRERVLISGVDCAIKRGSAECLACLLDQADNARPVVLSFEGLSSLVMLPNFKTSAQTVSILSVLKSRGYDFKTLERESGLFDGGLWLPFADILLICAQRKGYAGLLRFIITKIGIVSTKTQLNICELAVDDLKDVDDCSFEVSPNASVVLKKYHCAACEKIGATKICTGCRLVRYCLAECSRTHWKTGGHKKVCKAVQRRATQSSSEPAASS